MTQLVRARALGRRFGARRALEGVDLDLAAGEFLLVTGPNGSGKTTLLRLLAGLVAPTAGTLEVRVPRERIGLLAHEPLVYGRLSAVENLELFGRLYRLRERRERVGMLLERFGLWDVRHERAGSYSRGMQQRLAVCRTLLHEPDVLLLDEPFNSLDAEAASALERELSTLREERTFVVATHEPERLGSLPSGRLALA